MELNKLRKHNHMYREYITLLKNKYRAEKRKNNIDARFKECEKRLLEMIKGNESDDDIISDTSSNNKDTANIQTVEQHPQQRFARESEVRLNLDM